MRAALLGWAGRNIMPDPKILLWDLETTDFSADWGHLLCAGYRWLGEKKVHVPSIMDYPKWLTHPLSDRRLCEDFREVLVQADMWITYFGKGFDVKFIQARLLEHKLAVLPNTPHVDMYFIAKANLALRSKRLAAVSEFLGTDDEKTPLKKKEWRKAASGDAAAIKYVIKHCSQDIKVLEQTYMRLRPLVRTHPRVAGLGPCRVCGSGHLQRRGTTMAVTAGPKARYHCVACGSWESRRLG